MDCVDQSFDNAIFGHLKNRRTKRGVGKTTWIGFGEKGTPHTYAQAQSGLRSQLDKANKSSICSQLYNAHTIVQMILQVEVILPLVPLNLMVQPSCRGLGGLTARGHDRDERLHAVYILTTVLCTSGSSLGDLILYTVAELTYYGIY